MSSNSTSSTSDVSNVRNIMGETGSVQGTSLPDVKGQEVKGIGKAPIRRELERGPSEAESEDRGILKESDQSQAVLRDANAPAIRLTGLTGLPE
jgi:hypothetical protein